MKQAGRSPTEFAEFGKKIQGFFSGLGPSASLPKTTTLSRRVTMCEVVSDACPSRAMIRSARSPWWALRAGGAHQPDVPLGRGAWALAVYQYDSLPVDGCLEAKRDAAFYLISAKLSAVLLVEFREMRNPYSDVNLGNCLRVWRQRAELSQENAAAMLGVASTTWSHWETGRRLPTPHLLFLLRELTGIPVGVMLCENAKDCPHAQGYLYTE